MVLLPSFHITKHSWLSDHKFRFYTNAFIEALSDVHAQGFFSYSLIDTCSHLLGGLRLAHLSPPCPSVNFLSNIMHFSPNLALTIMFLPPLFLFFCNLFFPRSPKKAPSATYEMKTGLCCLLLFYRACWHRIESLPGLKNYNSIDNRR